MITLRRFSLTAPLAALLLLGGCAYDYASGYAPEYPAGYDQGMGGGQFVQPGDLFGGQNVASVDAFYAPLANYGRWVDSQFGYGFQPNVQQGWRPYVNGRWGENRLWISDDPWGWATDHYGRWGFDERIGWVWVPGTEWAPSWVAWREADDVTGWAPIPPNVNYSIGVGFGSALGGGFGGGGFNNFNNWYGPSWVWVQNPYLYQPGFGGRILPWNNGFNYWRGSRWNYNSGWNGRPGYNNWNNRPNNGFRPGYGRPDNRPNYNRPNYNRPDGTRPAYGRPGYDRPDGTRPGNGRPDYVRPGRDGQPGTINPRAGYQPGADNQGYVRADGQPNRRNSPGAGYNRGNGQPRGPNGYIGQQRQAQPMVQAQPSAQGVAPPQRAERQQQQPRAERAPQQQRAERATQQQRAERAPQQQQAERPQYRSRENTRSNERPQ